MKKAILLSLWIGICIASAIAQDRKACNTVNPGDDAPDFSFDDVSIPGKTSLNKKDLQGKYVILDFWTTLCIACVQSFPKLNALQEKFGNKMEFILVGSDAVQGRETVKAKEVFEKYRKFWNLNLHAAFDTSAFKSYGIQVVSWFVWIDPNGIIKGSTPIGDVTEENITRFLNGEEIEKRREESHDVKFDESKPLLIYGNGGKDTSFLARSIIAQWNPDSGIELPAGLGYGKFRARGLSLKQLYHYAFFGVPFFRNTANGDSMYAEVSNRFILESKDSALFNDVMQNVKRFSVEIDLPVHTSEKEYMRALQTLLANTFHLQANVEIREMPCWVLVATERAKRKLRTKSTSPVKGIYDKTRYDAWGPAGISFKNLPSRSIVTSIYAFHQQEPNFFDDTRIDYPIDFSMETIMTSLPDIRRALQEQGLNLVKSTRMLKTLVISDASIAGCTNF